MEYLAEIWCLPYQSRQMGRLGVWSGWKNGASISLLCYAYYVGGVVTRMVERT
jgi:hypothetical protein